MNSRKCDICDVDFHRASYIKHLRNKKQIENEKINNMVIPDWLFQEPIEKKIKKIYNPKSLKQIVKDNIRLGDKQLNKELAKKMLNPYYFTDRNLKVGFKFDLDGHPINQANVKLTIKPIYPEFGIEVRYINKIMKKISVFLLDEKININSNIKQ